MTIPRRIPAAALVLVAMAVLGVLGCGKKVTSTFLPNEKPTIRLTQAPVDSTSENFYAYRMNWVGFDPDGRIDYYVYRVDPALPPVIDNTWTRTNKNEETIFFPTVDSTRAMPGQGWRTNQFHRFAVAAVDNNGLASDPVYRSFFSYTVAPSVRIVTPSPGSVFTPIVTPSVRITWSGEDPDGVFTTKPVRWKFRLFGKKNPDRPDLDNFIGWAVANTDSFRTMYAPEFTSWQDAVAESTSTSYTNLTPNELYMFVVTGFDEAGAYAPDFSPNQNMLIMEVSFAGTLGPKITLFNEFFNYTYNSGGYAKDQSRWIIIEVPADQRVTFNWLADPPQGAAMRSYRWAMSGPPPNDFDVEDETQRTNENNDWFHWSRRSLNTTSATVGPFINNGETFFFYVEAEDNNGLRSLGIVRFTVVRPTFENELLFVDDTRLPPDNILPGNTLDPPRGEWPSAAELDTFFFAVGNVPWRYYPPAPGGGVQLTTPGLFAGYSYDTVGTRGIANGVLPLSVLGRYRHVVWYTDALGATYTGGGLDPTRPTSSLRKLTTPGNPSTLSTYMKQGGITWVMGGGAAYATLIEWNKRGSEANIYTDDDLELVPGRFMYDFSHWRSRVTMLPGSAGRKFIPSNFTLFGPSDPAWAFTFFQNPATAPGRGWVGQPDYSVLPPLLQRRNAGTPDPVPPLRSSGNFYAQNFAAEYIDRGNFIIEDTDGDPDTPGSISTLDTLYFIGISPLWKPIMTLYHGRDLGQDSLGNNRPFVFSGFPTWFWKRAQAMAIGDWVLRDLWGLQRENVPRGAPTGATRPARAQRPTAASIDRGPATRLGLTRPSPQRRPAGQGGSR